MGSRRNALALASVIIGVVALVLGASAPPASAYSASSTEFEQHWELLGRPRTISTGSPVNEPIARGSVSGAFDPAPTATLEVVGRVIGATSVNGWSVSLRNASGTSLGSVFFGSSDTSFSIKTHTITSSLFATSQLATLRFTSSGPVPGTLEVTKAYLKLKQTGPIKTMTGRVPLAGYEEAITSTSYIDVAGSPMYRHTATSFAPAPTIKLQVSGRVSIGTSGTVRVVDQDGTVAGSASIACCTATSATSGSLSLVDGKTYRLQVKADSAATITLYGADLLIEQSTSSSNGICRGVGWYPSVTGVVAVGAEADLNYMFNAPGSTVYQSGTSTWLMTASSAAGRQTVGDLRDRTAAATRATVSSDALAFTYKQTTSVTATPAGNDLDTRAQTAGMGTQSAGTPAISLSALRVAAELADCVAPTLGTLTRSSAAFSPNGDGVLDAVTFTATATDDSSPMSYAVSIKDQTGTTIRTLTGTGLTSPATVSAVWDGKDDTDTAVADGTFTATLSVADAHGNQASSNTVSVVVDTVAPSVGAVVAAPNPFSPNGDGVKDTTTFTATQSENLPWSLVVRNPADTQTLKTASGTGTSVSVVWDGRNQSGVMQPNASGYFARLVVSDAAGNQTTVTSPGVTIDTIPPTLTLSANPNPFDRIAGPTSFSGTVSEPLDWSVVVRPSSPIRTFTGSGSTISASWDGTNTAGTAVADGIYLTRAQATDAAGNTGSAQLNVTLDTTPPVIAALTATPTPFSPNADGTKDTVTIGTTITDLTAVTWSLEIRAGLDPPVRTFSGTTKSISVIWNGKDAAGVVVPEGVYTVDLEVTDALGKTSSASRTVEVDLSPPQVLLTAPSASSEVSGATTITADASDPSGVTSVEFLYRNRYYDGNVGGWHTIGIDTAAPYSATWDSLDAADGSIELAVVAIDGQGLSTGPTSLTAVEVANNDYLLSDHGFERTWRLGDQLGLSVAPWSGNARVTFDGGGINAAGPVEHTRLIYNSRSRQHGLLGYGWTLSGIDRLELQTNAAIVHTGNGGRYPYVLVSGSYVAPSARFDSLSAISGGYELTSKHGIVRTFNSSGLLTSVKDGNDRTKTISYNASGRPNDITHPSGGHTTITYTAGERINTITDSAGRIFSMTYNAADELWKITKDSTKHVSFTYASEHTLSTVTDLAGKQTTIASDLPSRDRVIKVTEAESRATTIGYPSTSSRTITNALANTWTYTFDARGGLLTQANPLNQTTTYQRNSNEQVTQTTDPLGNISTASYDAAGNLTESTDPVGHPLGKSTTYTYNALNLVTSITDPLNRTTNYTYDANGNLLTERTPLGNITEHGYDSQGDRIKTTNPELEVWRYTFDSAGRRLTVETPLGHVTETTYNSLGLPESTEDPLGNTRSQTYDSYGRPLVSTDQLGHTITKTYDDNGNLVSVTNQLGKSSSYTYDDTGRRLTSTTPLGHTNNTTYDALGRVSAQIDAEGGKTTLGYDTANRRASSVTPRGNEPGADPSDYRTTWTYDAAGRTTSIQDPLGNTRRYCYDAAGREVKVIDPRGSETCSTTPTGPHTTLTSYDLAGQIISRRDPKGNTTTYTYDDDGRRTGVTDPRGNAPGATPADYTTTTTYDDAGRVTGVVIPGRDPVTRSYDVDGRLTSSSDGTGTTTRTYDAAARFTSVTDPDGNEQTYTYDAAGRLTSFVDPRGNKPGATPSQFETKIVYDAAGRTIEVRNQLDHKRTWTYDDDGRVTSSVDPRGYAAGGIPATFTTSYTYDDVGRQLSVTYPAESAMTYGYDADGHQITRGDTFGTTTQAWDRAGRFSGYTLPNTPTVTRSYDAANNLSQLQDDTGTTTFTFNANNQIATSSGPYTQVIHDQASGTLGSYDPAGNPARLSMTAPTPDDTYDVEFNAANRQTSIAGAGAASIEYDYRGLLQAYADGAGYREEITTSAGGTATGVTYRRSTGLVDQSFAIESDAGGRPTKVSAGTTTHHTYTYDRAGRVTGEQYRTGAGLTTLAMSYDAAGNVGARTSTSPGGIQTTTNYSYSTSGRLTAETGTIYASDGNGNLVSALGLKPASYTWGPGNRLLQAQRAGTTVDFKYDGFGRIVERKTLADTIKPRYERDRLEALVRTNALGTSDFMRFVTAQDGRPLAIRIPGGSTYNYHYDAFGSVDRITLDDTLAVRYIYDSWGNIVEEVQGSAWDSVLARNPYRFMAAHQLRYDPGLRLYHLNGRFYDPSTGRFLSQGINGYLPCWPGNCFAVNMAIDLLEAENLPSEFSGSRIPGGRSGPVTDLCYERSGPPTGYDLKRLTPYIPTPQCTLAAQAAFHTTCRQATGADGCNSRGEATVCATEPYDCWRCRRVREDAFDETRKRYGFNGEDDKSDAFRHCYVSALMTMRANAGFAERMGTAHEEEGLRQGATLAAYDMDMHNNAVGRRVGLNTEADTGGPDSQEAANRCQRKEETGKLKILKK